MTRRDAEIHIGKRRKIEGLVEYSIEKGTHLAMLASEVLAPNTREIALATLAVTCLTVLPSRIAETE